MSKGLFLRLSVAICHEGIRRRVRREGQREGGREGNTYLAISRSRFETVARFCARAFPGKAVQGLSEVEEEGGREGGREGRKGSDVRI